MWQRLVPVFQRLVEAARARQVGRFAQQLTRTDFRTCHLRMTVKCALAMRCSEFPLKLYTAVAVTTWFALWKTRVVLFCGGRLVCLRYYSPLGIYTT